MARKIITQLTDDIDGTDLPDGTRSTTFSLDGTNYSIDLSSDNVDKLRSALTPYIDAGTRIGASSGRSSAGTRRSSGSGSSSTSTSERLQAIRGWAQSNGYSVGDRGRIKQDVVDAYNAAH